MTATPKPTGRSPMRLLPLFGALSLADLLLTCWLLRQPTEQFYEANPVARWWLVQFGWVGLAGFKTLVVLLVGCLCLVIARKRPKAANRILGFGCAISAAVVLYSITLYNNRALADEVARLELAELRLNEKAQTLARARAFHPAQASRPFANKPADGAFLNGRGAEAATGMAGAVKQAELPVAAPAVPRNSLTCKPRAPVGRSGARPPKAVGRAGI